MITENQRSKKLRLHWMTLVERKELKLLLCISGGGEKEAEQKRERIGAATTSQSRLVREEVSLVVARWKWYLLLACY
jgi:hypothetical protein